MRNALDLTLNVSQALNVPRRDLVRSIFGEAETHRAGLGHGFESEFAPFLPFPPKGDALRALRHLALGTLPLLPPDPSCGSRVERYPGGDAANPHPKERWLFINGICTDLTLVRLNAKMLHRMFGRPLTILYNACNGIVLDLLECAFGKQWDATTEAARSAFPALLDAIADPEVERVVLISHSQGTIVAAVLLKALEELLVDRQPRWGRHPNSPERELAQRIARSVDMLGQPPATPPQPRVRRCVTPEEVAKLEVYCFANCATSMEPFVTVGGRLAPWIESYGNEYDLVARLGMLAPTHGIGSARIGGDRYIRRGVWGHLLNAHYLYDLWCEMSAAGPVRPALDPFVGNLAQRPRLFDYARPVAAATPESARHTKKTVREKRPVE